MALYKRHNTWWVAFTAPNGERIRCSSGARNKQQAQEYHDKLKSEYWRIHKLGDKPRRTWQEAVIRWLQDTENKADHRKDIAKLRWFNPLLGDLFLDQIDRDLVDCIGQHKKSESSASTANRYLALLRSILRAARDEWEWIDRIPRVKLYREPKIRIRYLTPTQAGCLLSELPQHLADMAVFTLATGLRQSNVSYLKWDQVDLLRSIAWIHPDQSKSRKAISVPLNKDALTILHKRQNCHPVYIFTYRDKPVARTSTKAWNSALARAGIENFRWHDLRHTWASWHVQNGTSLQELQELGGWSSFSMVLRYAHLACDHLKAASQRIEGTILTQDEDANQENIR